MVPFEKRTAQNMKKQTPIPTPEPEPEPTWIDSNPGLALAALVAAITIGGVGVYNITGWAVDQAKHAVRVWQTPGQVDNLRFNEGYILHIRDDLNNEATIRNRQVAELKARVAKLEPVFEVDTEPTYVITNTEPTNVITNAIIYSDKTAWTNVYHFDKNVK